MKRRSFLKLLLSLPFAAIPASLVAPLGRSAVPALLEPLDPPFVFPRRVRVVGVTANGVTFPVSDELLDDAPFKIEYN